MHYQNVGSRLKFSRHTQYRYIQTLTQYEQSVSDLERAIGLYQK